MVLAAGIFVVGTDRAAGATSVACGILGALRERGLRVAPLKPVAVGWAGAEPAWPPEAAALHAASGLRLRREEVAPYAFRADHAPALAAERGGSAVDLKVLDRAYEALSSRSQLVVVDATGGLAAPVLRDPWFTNADLAFNWGMPVVIVVKAGTDAINHAALTVEAAKRKMLQVLGLVVNDAAGEPGAVESASPETLAAMTGLPLLGVVPHRLDVDVPRGQWQGMVPTVAKALDLWRIQNVARPVAAR